MRHPGSGSFEALLLGQLLDHQEIVASLLVASPVEESQKEMLELIPNLMGNHFRRTKKIPSVAAILAIGKTITETNPYISSSEICKNLLVSGKAGSSLKSTSSSE